VWSKRIIIILESADSQTGKRSKMYRKKQQQQANMALDYKLCVQQQGADSLLVNYANDIDTRVYAL
jgi:hypothetical protein